MFNRSFNSFSSGVLCCIAAVLISTMATADSLKPEEDFSTISTVFAKTFPSKHLSRTRLNDAIAATAWTNYLASMDFDRVYFLASDIENFRKQQQLLDNQLKAGQVDFAYEVFEVYKERVQNRFEYVKQLLEKGFDLEKDEEYRWRRKKEPWPRDKEEWNAIWRKKIKNDYVQNAVRKKLAEQEKAREVVEEKKEKNNKKENSDATENDADNELKPLTPEDEIIKQYKQLNTVLQDYDAEWVLERYLTSFAHAYDPHSGYLSPSSVEDFNIEMKLSLVGIGALLKSTEGTAEVVRIIPGGPADKDGRLQPGDRIIAVAQGDKEPSDVRHLPLNKTVRLIRGEKNTKVVLTVIPASDPTASTTKKIDIIRDTVELEEQAAKHSVEEITHEEKSFRLGVVRLPNFYADVEASMQNKKDYRSSSRDVRNILDQIKNDNVDGILLDLRNNGGGYLPEAVHMTGLFIKTGPVVQIRKGWRKNWLGDQDPSVSYAGPMVVLVNRLSASATEILAGALQDYGRAIIIGDSKTHGKGSVQAITDLDEDENHGKIKVTTSLFYRISGASTQLKGITPDIILPSPSDYMKIGEDHLQNAIEWTRTHPAQYVPLADLSQATVQLRKESRQRRDSNPGFEKYIELLQRIEKMYDSGKVPLQLEKRMKLAATERKVSQLQEELSAWEREEPDTNRDVVLAESLKILADLSQIQGKQPYPSLTDNTGEKTKDIAETVSEWLDWFF